MDFKVTMTWNITRVKNEDEAIDEVGYQLQDGEYGEMEVEKR